MGFKDEVSHDRAMVFLDVGEFGQAVDVEGARIPAVLDEVERGERDFETGLPSSEKLLFARTEELPARRLPGQPLIVDGTTYYIEDWREDMGVSEVRLVRAV